MTNVLPSNIEKMFEQPTNNQNLLSALALIENRPQQSELVKVESVSEEKLQELLNEVKPKEIFKPFNPLCFVNMNEEKLSEILAFLLNPKETHEEGNVFLKSFLDKLEFKWYKGDECISVDTEVFLHNSLRRHDILIRADKDGKTQWVISIENKLCGAVDQEEQLTDYIDDLRKYSENNYLQIYLPVSEADPSTYSISTENWKNECKNGHAISISANFIYEWLEDLSFENDELGWFVKQLKRYFKDSLIDLNEQNKLFIELEKKYHFEYSWLIENRQKIYDLFVKSLKDGLQKYKDNAGLTDWKIEEQFGFNIHWCNYIKIFSNEIHIEYFAEEHYEKYKNSHFRIYLPENLATKELEDRLALYGFNKRKIEKRDCYTKYANWRFCDWTLNTWASMLSDSDEPCDFAGYLFREFNKVIKLIEGKNDE